MPRFAPRVRAALALALLLVVPALAGCLGSGPPPAATPAPSPAPTPVPDPPANQTPLPPPRPAPRRVSFGGASNEVSIAVDPSNPDRIVVGAKDYSLFFAPPCPRFNVWSGIYGSTDGGRLWRHNVVPGFPRDPRGGALSGYRCASDPVVAFDAQGVAYYAGLAYGTVNETVPPSPVPLPPPPVPPPEPPNATFPVESIGPSALFVAKSKDGGLTWDEVHVVIEDRQGAVFHDKEALAIDPGSGALYLAWSGLSGNSVSGLPVSPGRAGAILVAKSTDGAVTWSRPLAVAPVPPVADVFGAALAVAGGRVVLAFIGTDPSGASQLYAAVSTDGAQTFGPARAAAPVKPVASPLPNSRFRAPTIATLAADPGSGLLLAAWNDASAGDSDIVVSTSADGEAWGAPRPLHADTKNDQFFPAAAFTGDGDAVIVYYDRRGDPANKLVQVSVARSSDQGRSWDETLLDMPGFDGDLSLHQSGVPFLGDYIGIATAGTRAWVAFTATPFGRGDVFVQEV